MKKLSRKKFDEDRKSYWENANKGIRKPGANDTVILGTTMLALLTDIHTMLEHVTVEPYKEEEDDAITVDFTEVDA